MPLCGALALAVLFASVVELRLALRGYVPTALDSPVLWAEERERARTLGGRALILVGASRMQSDVDLEVLRARTGLEPVQLAIDGTGFLPVLEGLARDPAIVGTVVLDYAPEPLVEPAANERARAWQAAYERARLHSRSPFERAEHRLGSAWREHLRSYADGATPLTSLRQRVLSTTPQPQYTIITYRRARLIDFSRMDVRTLYYARAARHLGAEGLAVEGKPFVQIDRELRERIGALTPRLDGVAVHAEAARRLAQQIAALHARGGRVLVVAMPTSGFVRAIDERRYPRPLYWDAFVELTRAPALHFADVPAWRDLACPDGSHLDARQRAGFTRTLVDALALAKPG